MSGFRESLCASAASLRANAGLRRLMTAAAIAEVSAPVYYTASAVWAFREGGAMLAATLGVVAMVPAAVVAPFAAVVTDRARKERVIVVSLAARAAFLLLLAAGVAFDSTWLVLAAAALASMCARVLYPALAALLPSLARSRQELVSANALVSGIENVGCVVGPALAGVALIVVSPAAVCAAAALGTLAAAAAAIRIRTIPTPTADPESQALPSASSPLREISAGFTSIASDPRTRSMVATHTVQAFAIGALGIAVVQLAIDDLELGAPGLGMLESALAVGGVAGGIVALGRAANHSAARSIRLGAVLFAVPLCVAAALLNPAAALAGLAIAGVGNVLLDVAVYTHVQETTAEAVLARTVAALQSIAVAAVGLGSLAAGVALSLLGTAPTLAVLALSVPAAALTLIQPETTLATPPPTPTALATDP